MGGLPDSPHLVENGLVENRLADLGLEKLWSVLPEARVVGGAVRDWLAGRPVADIDLATPRLPEQVTAALSAAAIRVIPTGLAHGTVTALVDGQPFEITTLRRDVSTDGRHAVVDFTADWRADAARRDFTINAMSMDRQGSLYDYFYGHADLAAGRVRFVGEPEARIAEDFLRVLRFFRFFGRYGRVAPDPATRDALRRGGAGLHRLSAERVWSELLRILAIPDPGQAISLMDELNLLVRVVPGPLDPEALAGLVARGAPADPLLRLAALSGATPDRFVERFRMSAAEAARLTWLRGEAPADETDDLTLRQWLIDVPKPHLLDRTWLHGRGEALRARIAILPPPVFPVQGRDLLALGMTPGPEIGRRLAELRAHWRQGGGITGREALLAMVPPPPA